MSALSILSEWMKTSSEQLEVLTSKIDSIECKVKDLDDVTIINGDKDGLPTMFQRNVFYQKVYNEIDEMKRDRERKEVLKYSITSINWWLKNMFPIIITLLVIVSFVLLLIGQRELANEVKGIIQK